MTLAQFSLRWIEMHDAVTCSIPGAKRPEQVAENVAAADLPPLSSDAMRRIKALYDSRVRAFVHQSW
jgi:aryl-alcohol dehydrogenase-like predicted oxidoreductase